MAPFDPYHKWLGIPPDEQPPNHYRLLAIPLLEADADVIEGAAERQTIYLRTFQTGPNSELAEQLLNEVSAARVCLLDGKSKARYDQQLKETLQPVQPSEPPVTETLPEESPLPLVASGPRAVSRSSAEKPIWQQPWVVVTAGAVGLIVLLVILYSSSAKMLAPANAVAPFDAKKAKQHQQDWAEYLGVPVDLTNSIGMKFMLIPPGEFMMGSPESEKGRQNNERQHRVNLTRPFYLSVYEVTQKQYQQVMGENPSHFKGSKNPVEKVSWKDAVVFCQQLSQLPGEKVAGRSYRLSTEAEWEYACRAGTATDYYFGSDASGLGDYAWYDKNSGKTTHPVGQKLPNPWGLYDMHGNVWEWCRDWVGDYPSGNVTDPTGHSQGSSRIRRGGSWRNRSDDCRSAKRRVVRPLRLASYYGFRVASSSVK